MWTFVGSAAALACVLQAGELERRLDDCVRRLGSADASERDRACEEIREQGIEALEVLERHRGEEDPEVRVRVESLVREIRGLEGEVYGDAPRVAIPGAVGDLAQTLQELCAQAGFPPAVRVRGKGDPRGEPSLREAPFFEAVDEVARSAGFRVSYRMELPLAESAQGLEQEPRMQAMPEEDPGLPLAYSGPLRIAVDSVEMERVWDSRGERWEVRAEIAAAWPPAVRPVTVENVVHEAVTDRGERLRVIDGGRGAMSGRATVVLAAGGGARRFTLRGVVRVRVPEVLVQGTVRRASLWEGEEVRLGIHRFTVRREDVGEEEPPVFDLVPRSPALLEGAGEVWITRSGEQWAFGLETFAELARGTARGTVLRVSLAGGFAETVGVVARARAVDHPYEFDLPYPEFWPGSE